MGLGLKRRDKTATPIGKAVPAAKLC